MNLRNFKKVLITGMSGSGGSYLAEFILEYHPQVKVHGTARNVIAVPKNLEKARGKLTVHECDLNDFSAVLHVLKTVKPDVIFHLASNANVRASFINPLAILENNIGSTAN